MPWRKEAMKDAITGETLRGAGNVLWSEDIRMGKPNESHVSLPERELTGRIETSKYPEEKKSKEIPLVAASETGRAQTGEYNSPGL